MSAVLDFLAPADRRMFIVLDGRGRRVVMPRYSATAAIEQVARAVAGRGASADQKAAAWERLRDQQGFRLGWVDAAEVPQRLRGG